MNLWILIVKVMTTKPLKLLKVNIIITFLWWWHVAVYWTFVVCFTIILHHILHRHFHLEMGNLGTDYNKWHKIMLGQGSAPVSDLNTAFKNNYNENLRINT